MAEEDTHDIGALWTTVRGQGTQISKIGTDVTEGFRSINEAISRNQERTDKSINELTRDTNAKFENVAANWQQTSAQRNAGLLTIIGILLTTMVGIGGLMGTVFTIGATVYTFTKQPIDQNFTSINEALKATTEALKGFVPKEQVAIFEKKADANGDEIVKLKVAVAELTTDHKWIDGKLKELTTLPEFLDLKERVSNNERRWNGYIDKLIATPAYPCIADSGAGCVVRKDGTTANGSMGGTGAGK